MAGAAPFDAGRLDVGDGHVLHCQQVGDPGGVPVVYLHGGPGTGCGPGALDHFHPTLHHAVLIDQRGAGLSTPHASEPLSEIDWSSIDLAHHIADIEAVREHLGIERWAVVGYSWGSVLGLAYAERHPERVTGVVLGAVSVSTREDLEWLTVQSGRFFPEQWHEFVGHIPPHLRGMRIVEAYRQLLFDPDPAVHEPAAAAWCRWEDAHVATTPGATPNPRYLDPRFRLALARQVTHCWSADAWLADDQLVAQAGRLEGIPGVLVHGALDVSSPLMGPWRMSQAWPGCQLRMIAEDGHGGDAMFAAVRDALWQLTLGSR